jgi:hypothetical protein
VVPPLVSDSVMRTTLSSAPAADAPARGVLLGNIWGQRWLELLRQTLRGTSITVDWYCNVKNPQMLNFDRTAMEQDGIRLMNPVHEADLPATLARYFFALIPTDPLDGLSPAPVEAIAMYSLPSRIPTLVATSQLPMLVVGNPVTSAAGFVRRFSLGEVVPYEQKAVQNAVAHLLKPQTQGEIRDRSLALSPGFSARGSGEWIWRSLEAGAPCDMRYETLLPPLRQELAGAMTP